MDVSVLSEPELLTDHHLPFSSVTDQRPWNLWDFGKNQRVSWAHAVPAAAHYRVVQAAAAESPSETVSIFSESHKVTLICPGARSERRTCITCKVRPRSHADYSACAVFMASMSLNRLFARDVTPLSFLRFSTLEALPYTQIPVYCAFYYSMAQIDQTEEGAFILYQKFAVRKGAKCNNSEGGAGRAESNNA